MVSGAIYFLEGLIGRKKADNGLKKGSSREKQKKPEIVSVKKGISQKSQKVISLKVQDNFERKKALEELVLNTRKTLASSTKLKEIILREGSDIDKLQLKAFCAQMKIISKMLEGLTKK